MRDENTEKMLKLLNVIRKKAVKTSRRFYILYNAKDLLEKSPRRSECNYQ